MPILPLVEREHMTDDMKLLLDLSNERGAPKELLYRTLAHSPAQMKAYGYMWNTSFFEGNVDHTLKELARLNVAFHYGCPF
jgi:hypothetical protein